MNTPTPEQREALQAFANSNGRYWKHRLLKLWVSGKDRGLLRQVRNEFGPEWLLNKCDVKRSKS